MLASSALKPVIFAGSLNFAVFERHERGLFDPWSESVKISKNVNDPLLNLDIAVRGRGDSVTAASDDVRLVVLDEI